MVGWKNDDACRSLYICRGTERVQVCGEASIARSEGHWTEDQYGVWKKSEDCESSCSLVGLHYLIFRFERFVVFFSRQLSCQAALIFVSLPFPPHPSTALTRVILAAFPCPLTTSIVHLQFPGNLFIPIQCANFLLTPPLQFSI